VIYDKFAARYDRAIAPLERRFLSRWREETLSRLPADSTILEIGAGTGLNFRFYPECRSAVASEISCEMLKLAKTRTASIDLIQADAQSLPFGANTFDAAFATLVFCSIPEPDKAFAEIIRILRPNGRLVLLEHVRPNGLPGYLFDFINLFTVAFMEDHFNRRTAVLAEAAGLKIVEIRTKAFGIVNLIVCEVVK
jgi:ubiquinone/menaquinone biosynthesis C-methylase UbiE